MDTNLAWNGTNQTLINGYPAQQNELAALLWEAFFRISSTRYRAVEIGTGMGGFTRHIARFVDDLVTIDNANRWHTGDPLTDHIRVFGSCVINRRISDVYTESGIKIVQDSIQEDDQPVIVFCDGGNKPLELKLFSPFLRPGDIIAVHDYMPRDVDEKEWRYWGWKEVGQEDIRSALSPSQKWYKVDFPFVYSAWSVYLRLP